MPVWFEIAGAVAAIAYALLAGVFLAFSDFIMRALSRAGPCAGVEVMQHINREVFRYVFLPLFMALAPASLVLGVVATTALEAPGAGWILAAALLYLVGAFGVTAALNVPLNHALDRHAPDTAAAARLWRERYLPRWTRWNTVRALAAAAAACCSLIGALAMA